MTNNIPRLIKIFILIILQLLTKEFKKGMEAKEIPIASKMAEHFRLLIFNYNIIFIMFLTSLFSYCDNLIILQNKLETNFNTLF